MTREENSMEKVGHLLNTIVFFEPCGKYQFLKNKKIRILPRDGYCYITPYDGRCTCKKLKYVNNNNYIINVYDKWFMVDYGDIKICEK